MVGDARAGDLAEIDAEVETIGLHHLRQCVDAAAGELPQIRQFRFGQAIQVGDLFVRHDQQMSAVVGIGVEQCEARAVAHNDTVRFVVIGLGDAGEQAGIELRFGRQDVFDAPRRVQRFHDNKGSDGNAESQSEVVSPILAG